MASQEGGAGGEEKKHFVLVHGACHGAWCWYKVATLLRSEGHRVTALDLGACGVRPESFSDFPTFSDYSRPLMDAMASLPVQEKVVLVGHSFGGISVAFAMESFPEKISAAVFVSAFMPDCTSPPSYILEQLFRGATEAELVDTEISCHQLADDQKQLTVICFGPNCMSSRLYQNCAQEDVTLGRMLVRPGSLYLEELSESPKLSPEKFGSVTAVYVVCSDDMTVPEEVQLRMLENKPPAEVIRIEGSDHMPMLSKPKELFLALLNIAQAYP